MSVWLRWWLSGLLQLVFVWHQLAAVLHDDTVAVNHLAGS